MLIVSREARWHTDLDEIKEQLRRSGKRDHVVIVAANRQ